MAEKKKFSSEDVKTLRFPESIQKNPGMYIGGTDASALWVIVREMLDNAVDEHLAGRGSSVTLFADAGTYWVLDDANGIPQGVKSHEMMINGKKTVVKTPTMQAIFGELHTSGKFEANAAYAASRGTHGIGVKATNALSDSMEIWTLYEGSWYYIAFKNGHLATEVTKLKAAPKKWDGKAAEKGTLIKVLPNYKIFSAKQFPATFANEWAELAAYLTPGFKVAIANAKGSKDFFSKRGPVEYIENTMEKLKCAGEKIMFEFKSELADVIVAFTNFDGYAVKGYTNGLYQSSGGKHVDSVSGALYTGLKPFIKTKKVKVDGKNKDVPAFREADLKEGLVGLVNMYLSKATFTSQDKAKLSDDRAGEDFEAMLTEEATKFFKGNKALAERICDRATKMNELKSKFTMSKQAASKLNAIKRNGLPAKYAAYDSRTKVQDRELYIVEGDSAGGTVKKARFPYQAVLPLKGKIMNALKDAADKTLSSEEILNILAAIGYDVNASDPYSKLQVGKIICLADPDPDGPFVGDTKIQARLLGGIASTYGASHLYSIADLASDCSKGIPYEVPVWDGSKEVWAPATASLVRNVDTLVALEIGGSKYKVSEDHKFLLLADTKAMYGRPHVESRFDGLVFVRAADLKIGDRVFKPANNGSKKPNEASKLDRVGFAPVSKLRVQHLNEPVPVYCLTVPKHHSFILPSGIVSSNCHINSLLLGLFYRYLPELFERGMVYVAASPEFYAVHKDELLTGASMSEVAAQLKARNAPASVDIRHVKGYGELNESLMRMMAMDPNTRSLIQIGAIEDEDRVDFVRLMNDDVEYRRNMLGLPGGAEDEAEEAPAKTKIVKPPKEVAEAAPAPAKKVAKKTVAAKKVAKKVSK